MRPLFDVQFAWILNLTALLFQISKDNLAYNFYSSILSVRNASELKKNWVLNREAFDKLLTVLGAFAEDSAVEYENIRKRLNKFFSFNGLSEEHTDKVIDVVARKISEENLELDKNYQRYFSRVAQNYLKDFWKSKENKGESFDELPPLKEPSVNPLEIENSQFEKESKLDCMKECLTALPKDDARLIEQYYSDKKGRDKLTRSLGITKNLLRVRVLRLKNRLENCIVECVKKLEV